MFSNCEFETTEVLFNSTYTSMTMIVITITNEYDSAESYTVIISNFALLWRQSRLQFDNISFSLVVSLLLLLILRFQILIEPSSWFGEAADTIFPTALFLREYFLNMFHQHVTPSRWYCHRKYSHSQPEYQFFISSPAVNLTVLHSREQQ